MSTGIRRRVRWGNVGVLASVVVGLAMLVGSLRGGGAAERAWAPGVDLAQARGAGVEAKHRRPGLPRLRQPGGRRRSPGRTRTTRAKTAPPHPRVAGAARRSSEMQKRAPAPALRADAASTPAMSTVETTTTASVPSVTRVDVVQPAGEFTPDPGPGR